VFFKYGGHLFCYNVNEDLLTRLLNWNKLRLGKLWGGESLLTLFGVRKKLGS